MRLIPIPYSFVSKRLRLSWRDALWGYEHKLLGWSDIVELATYRLSAGSSDAFEVELAGLTKRETHQVGDLLRKLASASPEEDDTLVQSKWLYLLLAWLFENKASISDPLGEVEIIYADFDYPPEIESFVRYMPVSNGYDPSVHSQEENENRLFSNWRKYLDVTEAEFKKTMSY